MYSAPARVSSADAALVHLIDGLQEFSAIFYRGVIISIGIICKKETSHGSVGVSMILAEFIDTRHSGCIITASETVDKLVCCVIITDCDHGIQVVIQGYLFRKLWKDCHNLHIQHP